MAAGRFAIGVLAAGAILAAGASRAEPTATLDEKGFVLRGTDATFTLGGRAQIDGGEADATGIPRPVPDVVRARRLWLEPSIAFGEAAVFGLQYDVASRTSPINNLVLTLRGPVAVSLGQFKEPFGFQQLTSDNNTTFMERALPDAFSPARNTGIAAAFVGEAFTLSGGVFGGNVNRSVDRDGIAGTARATWTPVRGETEVLHLGVAGSWRALDRTRGVAFDQTPESFVFRPSLVDTDTIDGASAVGRLGLEAAYQTGPFRLQGEFAAIRVERAGASSLGFRGGYLEGSWVVNGDGAAYGTKVGGTATEIAVFGGVEPKGGQRVSQGGIGVFQLAARYSALDLDSRDVRGGFQQDATLGLNWYPEPFIRVMANYVHAWVRDAAPTGRRSEADIGQGRLQIFF